MSKKLGGIKFDDRKIRHELVSDLAKEMLALVLTFGAKKYADDNWRNGFSWRRVLGATHRHLGAFAKGNDIDEETGLPHIAHAFCCVMFLVEFYLENNGLDDRWKTKVDLKQYEKTMWKKAIARKVQETRQVRRKPKKSRP